MKVIIKRPDEKVGHYADIENSLETLQNIVHGYIETYGIRRDTVMIANEEGKLLGLEPNLYWGPEMFVGTVVVAGCAGDEFTHVPVKMEDWETLLRWWGNEIC